jgi:outer membrane protein assembly factor BamE (lipoprotein component of BamABCDE complex)
MKRVFALLLTIVLAGCVSDGRSLRPGDAAEAVRAEMGTPALVVPLPDGGQAWFYPRGRVGRQTFRAELAPDGRLRKVEQVLDEQHFDQVIARKTTREELLRMLGPPAFQGRGSAKSEDYWEYTYYWGAQQPWLVRFGIDDQGLVTGQIRISEMGGPAPGRM